MASGRMSDTPQTVTANGRKINAGLPVSLHGFLESQGMLPRSVVVELNGEAVPPSEFLKPWPWLFGRHLDASVRR